MYCQEIVRKLSGNQIIVNNPTALTLPYVFRPLYKQLHLSWTRPPTNCLVIKKYHDSAVLKKFKMMCIWLITVSCRYSIATICLMFAGESRNGDGHHMFKFSTFHISTQNPFGSRYNLKSLELIWKSIPLQILYSAPESISVNPRTKV